MKNQVIKVLNREYGKKVIAYWKSKGIDVLTYDGSCTQGESEKYIYYGVIDGVFGNYSFDRIEDTDIEIIELPAEYSYPRVMWVWDGRGPNPKNEQRVVFMEKNGKYLAWSNAKTFEKAETIVSAITWDNAEDIIKKVIVELTLEDISAGKGVGIPVHLIRIKR